MSIPKVTISFQNGQLGKVDDPGAGYPGMIVVMATAPTDHAFGEVVAYSSYDDLPDELQAIAGVENFFNEAEGYTVYIMPVSSSYAVEDIVDPTSDNAYAKKLANYDDDINYIGVVNSVVALDSIATAGTNAKALRTAIATKYHFIRTFMAVNYSSDLPDLGEADYTGTGFIVCPNGDEVGLFLARRAKIAVQRNVGRVKDGALTLDSAQLIDGTDLEDSEDEVKEVYGKRYICLRTYVGKSGYYFVDDPLAVDSTDDYAQDGNRAVIDKAARLAYETYVDELNNDVETDSDGTISTTAAKELQSSIESAINESMTSNGEISECSAYVDETQNIVSTDKITIALGITPLGYLKQIVVELGFEIDDDE